MDGEIVCFVQVRRGPKGRTDVPTELLVEMAEQGYSSREISGRIQMSRSGIRNRLRRYSALPRWGRG